VDLPSDSPALPPSDGAIDSPKDTSLDTVSDLRSDGSDGGTSAVVDTIGTDPATTMATGTTSSSNVTKANFYSVSTARTLLKIEFYMNIISTTALTWVVYEATSQTSAAYAQISSSTTSAGVGQGYQSSGALSIPLKAGYYYAIGVSWGSVFENYWYNSASVFYPVATSFGALIGSTTPSSTAPTSLGWASSTSYYPERLTTSR